MTRVIIVFIWLNYLCFEIFSFQSNRYIYTREFTRFNYPQSVGDNKIRIALTRESGANDKLANLLSEFTCIEIPCIEFCLGSDLELIQNDIVTKSHDIIVITSPQGANVFIDLWKSAGKPPVTVAVVGKGTALPLLSVGIQPVFQPSDFTGSTCLFDISHRYSPDKRILIRLSIMILTPDMSYLTFFLLLVSSFCTR